MGGQAHYRLALLVAGAACVALAACATHVPEPVIVTKTVTLQVPVACSAQPIPRPEYMAPTLAALAAMPDMAARYQALSSDIFKRIPYEAGLEQTLAACGVK